MASIQIHGCVFDPVSNCGGGRCGVCCGCHASRREPRYGCCCCFNPPAISLERLSVQSFVLHTGAQLDPNGLSDSKAALRRNTDGLFETEEGITDVSVSRRYVLCPATTYRIDRFNDVNGNIANTLDDFNNTAGFQYPLILRPNLLVQCGDSGNIDNNCVFAGGDYSVFAEGPPRRGETLHNVVIKGMRFVDAQRVGALLQQPGDVTFVDCSFKVSGAP